jgi:hypothetical protein
MLVSLIPPPLRIRRRRGLTANVPMMLHDHLREAFSLPEDNPPNRPFCQRFRAAAVAIAVLEG